MDRRYRLLDLFCGCGGLSRGFERSGRFSTEAGVELHSHPAAAFRANLTNQNGRPPHTFVGDIDELATSDSLIWEFLSQAGIRDADDIDAIVGGPPCQGFSRNGVRRYQDDERTMRFYDHPKNHLYKSFLRFVELVRPKVVLVENVREFLNYSEGRFSSDLLARFGELGYDVDFQKLCAADFGVPQLRFRVFFLAIRKDVTDITGLGPKFPSETNAELAGRGGLPLLPPYRTVRDAFQGLPTPAYEPRNAVLQYREIPRRSELFECYRAKDGSVHNHIARRLSAKQMERIRAVGTGRMRDIEDHLKTRNFYGSAYRRLKWDEPALTVTTWVYHVGSGQFAHPDEDRGITMREAARLQTFDDDFVFPALINPVSQMIGNAVPPMLAAAFAREIATVLDAFVEVPQTRVHKRALA